MNRYLTNTLHNPLALSMTCNIKFNKQMLKSAVSRYITHTILYVNAESVRALHQNRSIHLCNNSIVKYAQNANIIIVFRRCYRLQKTFDLFVPSTGIRDQIGSTVDLGSLIRQHLQLVRRRVLHFLQSIKFFIPPESRKNV